MDGLDDQVLMIFLFTKIGHIDYGFFISELFAAFCRFLLRIAAFCCELPVK